MGSDGMRASLASRETIADSIELAVSGHCLDAVVMLVGCDKTIPAAAMTAARLDIPTVILYGGTIMPGQCRANDGTARVERTSVVEEKRMYVRVELGGRRIIK